MAQSYIDATFHDLSAGNRSERRAMQGANQAIWAGGKQAMKTIGKALEIAGIAIAAKEAYDDYNACPCEGK
jgi:hypothetical protein